MLHALKRRPAARRPPRDDANSPVLLALEAPKDDRSRAVGRIPHPGRV